MRLTLKAEQLSLFGDGSIRDSGQNYLGTDRIGRPHWRARTDKQSAGAVVGDRALRWFDGEPLRVDERGRILPDSDWRGEAYRRQVAVLRSKESPFLAGKKVSSPEEVAAIFRPLVDSDRERLWALHVDAQSRPIAVEAVSVGSINSAPAYPREMLANAAAMGSAAVWFIHNHPSGSAAPSPDDVEVTHQAAEYAKGVGVRVAGHVVVAEHGWASIRQDPAWIAMPVDSFRAPKVAATSAVPEIEGRIVPAAAGHWPALVGAKVAGPSDVAKIGRTLFDPENKLACLLAFDVKNHLIGVFPFAAGDVDRGATADRLDALVLQVKAATGAAACAVAIGADGKEWRQAMSVVDSVMKAQRELTLLDIVIVGPRDHRSRTQNGWIFE